MFYTDESVNQLLHYSKGMVDNLTKNRPLCQELKDFQYLTFAGMISHYGFEHIQEIAKTFEKTNLYYTSLSLSEGAKELEKRIGVSIPIPQDTDETVQPAVSFSHGFRDLAGRFHLSRVILISEYGDSVLDKIEMTVHEVNHQLNSIVSPICTRDSKFVRRIGVSFSYLENSISEAQYLEEAFNVLQTNEIVNEILEFTQFNIQDPKLASILDQIRFAYGNKGIGTGYESIVPLIQPLYEQKEFHSLLVNHRLDGNLKKIRENFNERTEPDAFSVLSQEINIINCNPSFYAPYGKVKSLVKQYIQY